MLGIKNTPALPAQILKRLISCTSQDFSAERIFIHQLKRNVVSTPSDSKGSRLSLMDKEVVSETHQKVGELRAAIGIAAEATEGFSEAETLEWTEEFLARKGLSVPANLRTWISDARGLTAPVLSPRLKGEEIDATPTQWAWEGLVMAGTFNLLVAPPKVGKSALMVGMIGAWWHGESSYLGHALHGACPPVFIVGTDQPESDWLMLLRREGLVGAQNTLGGPVEALWHTGAPLHLSPKGIAVLAEYAARHPGALFLVDSYHACISPLGIDEATSAFDGPARSLAEALAPHGATLVMIHHTNKSVAGGNATNASRGSNALPAAASLTILMNWLKQPAEGQTQSDYRVVVKTQGRAKGSALLIELEDHGWVSHGDGSTALQAEVLAETAEELQGRQADAFDYIADRWAMGQFPVAATELAAHLNLPGNKANRCLQGLARKGLIKQVGTTEPGVGGGRPSGLFTPAEAFHPLPQEGVINGLKVKNPSHAHEIRGFSPLSPLSPSQRGGGFITPTPEEGEQAPRVGLPVEKYQGGVWKNGWVIQDASKPLELVIAKLGDPLIQFRAQRWLIDIRPCEGSPFAQVEEVEQEEFF